MSGPRLPARLRALAAIVPPDGDVADVGAGHGALSAHLATSTSRRIIATEAAPGPLAELRRNLARWGAEDRVETRLGLALDPIAAGEVRGVVVAGMGARTLLEVCAAAPSRGVTWLALQCVQDAELVEPWLAEHGFAVTTRVVAQQRGRTYPTWLVEVGR